MLPRTEYNENEKKMFTAAYEVWDVVPLRSRTLEISYPWKSNVDITKRYLVNFPLHFLPTHISRLFYFLHYRAYYRLYCITVHYSRLFIFNIILFIFLCTWKCIAIYKNTLVKVRDFNPTTQLWKYNFHFRGQPDQGNILAETCSWLCLINRSCLGPGCTTNTWRSL